MTCMHNAHVHVVQMNDYRGVPQLFIFFFAVFPKPDHTHTYIYILGYVKLPRADLPIGDGGPVVPLNSVS